MKSITFLFVFIALSCANSQVLFHHFEDFNLPLNEHLNNAGATGAFFTGQLELPNSYTAGAGWEAWTGWAISSETDVTTPGFMNQYSAITGEGYFGSKTYAVGYAYDPIWLKVNSGAGPLLSGGFYITNSTYAYLSMRDGDGVAKKFGGATGNDPDYLKLTIFGKENGEWKPDSIEFYLADYRFSDNSEDYIVDDWTWVDYSALGFVDSIMFQMTSTDVNSFGTVTPTYFCIDNFEFQPDVSATEQASKLANLRIFPNPTTEQIQLQTEDFPMEKIEIFDALGKLVFQKNTNSSTETVWVSDFEKGLYSLRISLENGTVSRTFQKM